MLPGEKTSDLALDATLKHAALREAKRSREPKHPLRTSPPSPLPKGEGKGEGERASGTTPQSGNWTSDVIEEDACETQPRRSPLAFPIIAPEDLHKKLRCRPCDNLIILVVDSSDSMGEGTEVRMRAAKGAVLAILRKAYQNRSRVALVAFGGEHAKVVLSPTRSISLATRQLERLPTGGATPFADGLFKAWQLARLQRLKGPGIRPVLVIISDGEANVPLAEGVPSLPEIYSLAAKIRQDKIPSVLIDVVAEPRKAIEMRHLAAQLAASYVKVSHLKPAHILQAVTDVC